MARQQTQQSPDQEKINRALNELQSPRTQWKILLQVSAILLVLWVLVIGAEPWIGYWGMGVMAIVTLAVIGFGIYAWRMFKKSQDVVNVLKGATTPEGRQEAIAKLEAKNDAVSDLARAQLVAQQDPQEAIRILEAIEIDKVPAMAQDDVRANLGLMYLIHNRAKDARKLADNINLNRQAQPQAKGMYAAVMAESFARTGKAQEAKKLLETYNPDDEAYGDTRAMLLRAQAYTAVANRKLGLAKHAIQKLLNVDPNMVMAFAVKSRQPELMRIAKQVLQRSGNMPKAQRRIMR